MPRSAMIEDLTMPEVREFRPEVVMLPLGSTEQHGPHLPLATDTLLGDELARRGPNRRPDGRRFASTALDQSMTRQRKTVALLMLPDLPAHSRMRYPTEVSVEEEGAPRRSRIPPRDSRAMVQTARTRPFRRLAHQRDSASR